MYACVPRPGNFTPRAFLDHLSLEVWVEVYFWETFSRGSVVPSLTRFPPGEEGPQPRQMRLEGSRQMILGESRQKHVGAKCGGRRGKTERQDARGRSHLLGVDQARCNSHGGHTPDCNKVSRRLTEGLEVLITNKKCVYPALDFCLLFCVASL